MGVRLLEGRADVPINIRVSASMKTAMDNAADKLRISTAHYIRLAVQEKLDRDYSSTAPVSNVTDTKLRELIREEVKNLLRSII